MSYFCSITAADEKKGTPDYAAALQEAKRWVRKQPPWRSPYYWATFTLLGPH